MSSVPKTSQYCCTCQHFGGQSTINGCQIEFNNGTHVCKIHSRGNANQGAMNAACDKWIQKMN